jgi:hypothetical protein
MCYVKKVIKLWTRSMIKKERERRTAPGPLAEPGTGRPRPSKRYALFLDSRVIRPQLSPDKRMLPRRCTEALHLYHDGADYYVPYFCGNDFNRSGQCSRSLSTYILLLM